MTSFATVFTVLAINSRRTSTLASYSITLSSISTVAFVNTVDTILIWRTSFITEYTSETRLTSASIFVRGTGTTATLVTRQTAF